MVKGALAEWGTCFRTIFLKNYPFSLTYWEGTIAVGLRSSDITIHNMATGSQIAILSGHGADVNSVVFSLDGTFLVSGSDDETVKLWDVQTGRVVKTFSGHTNWVWSVSISPDGAIIASGSRDNTIRLWNVQAGNCFNVIVGHNGQVKSVSFSPTGPQLLMSVSDDNRVQQWDIDGFQIGPDYEGSGIAFSADGTCFVSWGKQVATVRNSASRVVITEVQVSSGDFYCCCFSSNGKFMAGGVGHTIYIWNITSPDPHPIETFVGHTSDISSLIFPSSLISASRDRTVKFWQIGAPSTDPVATDTISTPPTPPSIKSVSLQVRDGVAISSDTAGIVKIWDILTGLCKGSFQTPAKGSSWRDTQLIEGRLIVVWHGESRIHIWDAEKGEILQIVARSVVNGIRISGDGSKVFGLTERSIQAWSIWTGEAVGTVGVEDDLYFDPLYTDGSRVWACLKGSPAKGWDFGVSGSSTLQLSNTFPDRPHLNFIDLTVWDAGPAMVKDIVTGKEVFQLVGRYATPTEVQWDGQYLVAGYESGEVLILDFDHVVQ